MAAFAAGVIGGFVGLQRRLKRMSDGDLELMANSWVYIWLSPLVGGVLAVVLYILFVSGLLRGHLFPEFNGEATVDRSGFAVLFNVEGTGRDYAKMLFWSFVAGFSERFVTDIISKFDDSSKSPAGDQA